MKRSLLFVFALLLLPSVASAQWDYAGTFPPDTLLGIDGNAMHGVAVDPDGKVWLQPYGRTDSVFVPETGQNERVTVLYVYEADGTPASFSPIKFVDLPGGERDTLGGFMTVDANGNPVWDWKTGRGIRADDDGNILVSQFNFLYRLDYKTGEGMNRVITPGGSKTAPAVDDAGNVYVGYVAPVSPILMYDKDFNFLGNAVDSARGFSRSFEVDPSGNRIYWAGFTNHAVVVYERPDEFSPFDSVGVVLQGMDSESMTFNPATGYLWVAAGSPNDTPNRDTTVTTNWLPNTWYAFDTAELVPGGPIPAPKDSLRWQDDGGQGRPRGLAFSPDGNVAYAVQFSQPVPAVQKFLRSGNVAVEPDDSGVPESFSLSQNYPNPFNPSTQIQFALTQSGFASLKVYDALGREVSTLLNEPLAAGSYTVTFDAGALASGTYLYVLQTDGRQISKTMVLMK